MQINLSKFIAGVTGVVILGLISFSCYLAYQLFFVGNDVEAVPTIDTLNVGAFGPKMQSTATALTNKTEKISFTKNDIAFTESALFKSFTELPQSVPLSEKRGREDPFIPYVAP